MGTAPYARHLVGSISALHQHRVADQANSQPLDGEGLTRLDDDGGVVGVFGMQLDGMGGATVAFDGDFFPQPGHHDLAVAGFAGGLHGQQVAVDDALSR